MNIEIKKNNKVSKVINDNFDFVIIFIIIFIFIISYFSVIGPKYQSTITSLRENINNQEKIYLEQKVRLDNLKIAFNLYEEIKKNRLTDVRKVNAVIPNDYSKERLFGEVERIISSSGFLLSSINITREDSAVPSTNSFGEAVPKTVGRMKISIAVGAIDYSGLKNLLITLENNNRLMDIQSVAFSPSAKTVNLEIYTYYYKPSL